MRWSLTTSLVLHGAILVAALVVLPNPNSFEVKPQNSIEVDISQIGDVSKRMATAKDAETPKEKPAPKKTDTLVKTDPAPKIDKKVEKAVKEAAAEPPPEPKVEPPKKEEPKPLDTAALDSIIKKTAADMPPPKKEEPKKTEAKPPDKPKKPEKKLTTKDLDNIANLLNKIPDSKAPEQASASNGSPAKGEKTLQGTDEQASADILDALTQKLTQCVEWPPSASEADVWVPIHFRLTRAGRLDGPPEVLDQSSDPMFDVIANAAVAAVNGCDFGFLPKERYDQWQDNTIRFNPKKMSNS